MQRRRFRVQCIVLLGSFGALCLPSRIFDFTGPRDLLVAELPGWLRAWEARAKEPCRTDRSPGDLEQAALPEPLALETIRRRETERDTCRSAYSWLATAKKKKNDDPQAAGMAASRALELAQRTDDALLLAKVSDLLALLGRREQRFDRALDFNIAAQHLWLHVDQLPGWMAARYEYGLMLYFLGLHDDSRKVLLDLRERIREHPSEEPNLLAPTLTILGRLAIAQEAHGEAEVLLSKALEIRQKYADPKTGKIHGLAANLDALSQTHMGQGEIDEADRLNAKVLELTRDQPLFQSNALATAAEIQLVSGRPREAVLSIRQARNLVRKHQLRDPNLDFYSLHIGSMAHRHSGDRETANSLRLALLARLDSFRQSTPGDLLFAYLAHRRRYVSAWITELLSDGRDEEAFEVSEWARARNLLDKLVWSPSKIRAEASAELVERDDELRRELEDLAWAIDATEDPEQRRLLTEQVGPARLALMRNEVAMRESVGAPAQRPIGLPEAQGLLSDDEVAVSYWLGEKESFAWVLDRSKLEVIDGLPSRSSIQRAAGRLWQLMAKGSTSRAVIDQELAALASTLIDPIAHVLHSGPSSLILVPDGALAEVPFSALPFPNPDAAHETRYLAEAVPVVVAHSLSTIAAIRFRSDARKAMPRRTLTAIGDAVYERNDPRLVARMASTTTASTATASATTAAAAPPHEIDDPRLPWSGWEVRQLAQRSRPVDAQWLVGFDASKEMLIDHSCASRSRFVHLGAHASLDLQNPTLSAVHLSTRDPTGRRIDGALRIEHIERIPIDADLVFLAACESARGPRYSGEEAIALPPAVLLAGASAVIASLWKIEDEPTALFVDRFWQAHLEWGLPTPMALQEARLALIRSEDWGHPSHWAGFVLLGDWRP